MSNAIRITGCISARSASSCGSRAPPAAATWCFIGALVRPSLWQVRLDLKALMLMPRIDRGVSRRRQSSVVGRERGLLEETAFVCLARMKLRRKSWCRKVRSGASTPTEQRSRRYRFGFRLFARHRRVRYRAGGGGGRQACAGGRSGGRHRPDAGARCRVARRWPHRARRRQRRAGEGAKTGAGPPLRFAVDRSAYS